MGDEPICPACNEAKPIGTRKNGFYLCNPNKADFTVSSGMIFERSHIPLHKWIFTTYLLMTSRKGVSSLQLGKEIGVTQKSAWSMLQRIREACDSDLSVLSDIVEIDETFIDGKEKHLHRCVGEFTFHLKVGDVKHHTLNRLKSLVTVTFGPRLGYNALTA